MSKVTFSKKHSDFYDTLKQDVNNYFAERKLKPTGNIKLYAKTLTLIPAALIIYVLLLMNILHPAIAITLCALLGFIGSSIGFNVMHDACHGSYSTKKWVNELLGYSLNALGSNAFIWKQKHNIVHHTYTNVDGIDDDIAKSPALRMCETQPKKKFHRFQYIYMMPLYAISSILWVFFTDFDKYFKKSVYTTPMQGMDAKQHLIFWTSKVLYVLFYIAIPVYVLGWMPWLIGFMVMHAAMGLSLSIVFQLAHVVENVEFVEAKGEDEKIEDEWAIHQLKTTSNFATENKFVSWFVGGLNFQVEHHLFPRISHVHYPAINKMLRQRCLQYNLPYNNYSTMREALQSHIRVMRHLGQ